MGSQNRNNEATNRTSENGNIFQDYGIYDLYFLIEDFKSNFLLYPGLAVLIFLFPSYAGPLFFVLILSQIKRLDKNFKKS